MWWFLLPLIATCLFICVVSSIITTILIKFDSNGTLDPAIEFIGLTAIGIGCLPIAVVIINFLWWAGTKLIDFWIISMPV